MARIASGHWTNVAEDRQDRLLHCLVRVLALFIGLLLF